MPDPGRYDPATGIATYTFVNAIPAAAKGTYTVSIDTRRPIVLNPAPKNGPTSVNEGAPNQPFSFAVTGTTVVPRRTSVQLTKCNDCHQDLKVLFSHGNQRITIEHCVICHNPNGTDLARRPADHSADPGESVEFARMIHRIHTGEELTQDYTIYGNSGQPGQLQRGSVPRRPPELPRLPRERGAATRSRSRRRTSPSTRRASTSRPSARRRPPARAATTAATSSPTRYINTAYFPNAPTVPAEACGTCHGTGTDLDVAKVHAR